MNKCLLNMVNVNKTYLMGEVTVKALTDINLKIYDGELLVILGPSGSGKSTLLNIIGGMDRASSGEVYFNNHNLSEFSDRKLTNYRRKEVGFVFQFYNLIGDLTALENVDLAANLVSNPLPGSQILSKVGLENRKEHFPSQLSGGEQQRISIARAVVKQPRLLLCDEPTGALDFQTGKKILCLLKEINKELKSTVIIVTHNSAIGNMAHRVVRMGSGKIIDIIENECPVSPERIEW